jgi:hypothetical protein
MWTIRQEQAEAFQQYHLQKFEDEMVKHSKEFAPQLCKVLGDDQLRVALRSATKKANGYGFTNKGPIRLFIELMFLCGSGFDTDPQYPGIGEVLRGSDEQMVRAERIHLDFNDYLERVSGLGAVNVHKALRDLAIFAKTPLKLSKENFVESMLEEMKHIFPQKVAYVGEAGLRALIGEGIDEARRYRFSAVRHVTLLVVLKFAFGHSCTEDPLYPWISRTLQDERIIDPATRAERLERKALTWLEHVVANNDQEAQA